MHLPIRITVTIAFVTFMALAVSVVAYINYASNQREIVNTARNIVEKSVDISRQNIAGVL